MSRSYQLIEETLIKFRLEMRNAICSDNLDRHSKKELRKRLDELIKEIKAEIKSICAEVLDPSIEHTFREQVEALSHIEDLILDLPELFLSLREEQRELMLEGWEHQLRLHDKSDKGEEQ